MFKAIPEKHRKKFYIIYGILVVIASITGVTIAWYQWQSENNTTVSFTVGGVEVTFDAGADITSSKLRPVSTKEVGVEKGYAIEKTITASSPMTAYLNLYLTLETLPDGLKEESFIWELYKDNALVGKGNFKNNNQGDKITIAPNQKIESTTSTYKLYIWIDGQNYANPETMQNQTFKFVLNADATDQPPLDASGANTPELLEGLIPIMYKEEKWVKADEANKEAEYQWYDYDSRTWANAVLVSDSSRSTYKNAELGTEINESDVLAYYVWVPRYKYKLFNAKKTAGVDSYNARTTGIDIVFESGTNSTGTVNCTVVDDGTESCENAENGEYYTHPAFTFGDVELTGIWVGKFELTGDTTTPTIKPNVSSLRNINVSTIYSTISKISGSSNTYGINNTEADSHMMKNMEWGAVAYLSNSKYGRCIDGSCTELGINNNSSYTTGCGVAPGSSSSSSCNAYTTETGMLASTTGNVYGIYDMSGGAYEYVMGNMVNNRGNFYSESSGFSTAPEIKYYDKYSYSASSTVGTRGHLGDATSEVVVSGNTGWNRDYAYFVNISGSWFLRGGGYGNGSDAGAFYFTYNNAVAYSSDSGRAVLVRRD